VPFTLRNLKEDLEDVGSRFDGAPDLEFRLATEALELEESGLSYQRVPPGYRFPYGHTHKEQEEVYVVVRGSGRMRLDDEIVEVKEWDAVRVPPGTWRGYGAWPGGLASIGIAAPKPRESRRADRAGHGSGAPGVQAQGARQARVALPRDARLVPRDRIPRMLLSLTELTKEKFDPRWEPRYLACEGGLALPRVLADISALVAGGYRRIFMR